MGKKKLQRFAEIEIFPNVVHVVQRGSERPSCGLKGKWKENFFNNNHPIVLELGCGKGEYTVGLAAGFPDKNFIGIDLKGNRIWRGAKTSIENKLTNAGFLRARI